MNNYSLTRGWMDHELFDNGEPFTNREAWIWLIENAAWKDTRKNINGKIITLKRGQLSHSIRFLAQKWLWHKNKVTRFFSMLKNETMIGTENGTGQLTITICNYDKYQLIPNYYGTENGTENGTARGQHGDSTGTKKNTLNTINTSKPSLLENEPNMFEIFWDAYPRERRGSREKAFSAYCRALKRATEEEIHAGLGKYSGSDEVARGFAKGATAWLNDDRWTCDYRASSPAAAHAKPAYGDSIGRAGKSVIDNIYREKNLREEEVFR